jgi:hypothetical protein
VEAQSQTTDNDVAIAAIEADKEIQIAEINAEARVDEAQAYSQANNRTEEQWDLLQKELLELREKVDLLSTQPIVIVEPEPLPVSLEEPEPITEAETLTALEQPLTEASTTESENPMELGSESVVEKLEVEVPLVRVNGDRARVPIIQLV